MKPTLLTPNEIATALQGQVTYSLEVSPNYSILIATYRDFTISTRLPHTIITPHDLTSAQSILTQHLARTIHTWLTHIPETTGEINY